MTEQIETRTIPFDFDKKCIGIKSNGKVNKYLEVVWRKVWFRYDHPHGSIETELVFHDPDKEFEEEQFVWDQDLKKSVKKTVKGKGIAIFKATVRDGKGGVSTGHGMEKGVHFPDYFEKAETIAEGRGLAGLGYGTQFGEWITGGTGYASDIDEGASQGRIADSPVRQNTNKGNKKDKQKKTFPVQNHPDQDKHEKLVTIKKAWSKAYDINENHEQLWEIFKAKRLNIPEGCVDANLTEEYVKTLLADIKQKQQESKKKEEEKQQPATTAA